MKEYVLQELSRNACAVQGFIWEKDIKEKAIILMFGEMTTDSGIVLVKC